MLDGIGCQVLATIALIVEGIMASHLNPKKDWLIWASQTYKWDACEGVGTKDINQRAIMCYEHVAAGMEASRIASRFHYSGDKGYAGMFLWFHILPVCECACVCL